MIERSADAWEHNQFKEVIVRVANVEMWVSQNLTDTTTNLFASVITRPCHSTCKNSHPF
jgi:hypothetical protein